MKSRTTKRLTVLLILIVLVVGVLGAVLARSALRQRTLRLALEAGMAAYARHDWAEGMKQLSTYVGRTKTNADAIYALADCRRHVPAENRKHLVSALAFARAAAEVAPADPKTLELVMDLDLQLGFLTEAGEAADKLLALDPNHLNALIAKTRTLLTIGKTGEALKVALSMAERHPDSLEAHAGVVTIMQLQKQDPKEIRAYAARVAAANPQSLKFAMLQCQVALTTGDTPGAIDSARRAVALPVTDAGDLSALVHCLDQLGPADPRDQPALPTSADILTRAQAEPNLAREAGFIAAEREWKTGLIDDARKALPVASPADTDAQLGLRGIILDPQDPAAKAAAAELATRTTDDAGYWSAVLRGQSALAARNYKAAIEELKKTGSPGRGYAEYCLGQTLAAAGDWRAATDQFDAAAKTDPSWWSARYACISLLSANGEFEEARRQANAALSFFRRAPQALAYFQVSVAMIEAGRADDQTSRAIIEQLKKTSGDNPDASDLTALLARALLATGNTAEAARLAETLPTAKTAPSADSLIRLAIGLRRAGSPTADTIDAMIRRSAGSPSDAARASAATAAAAGRPQEAIATLTQAASAATGADRTALLLQLGKLQDSTGDPKGCETLAALAAADPSDAQLQFAVLDSQSAWSNQGVIAAALTRLGALAGTESGSYLVYDARRRMTFPPAAPNERKADAGKIVLSLTPVAKAEPRNVLAALALAQAQLTLEDRSGAITTLSRCVDEAPDAAVAQARLIDLLQQDGRADEAQRRLLAFRSARDLPLPIQRERARLLAVQGMRDEYRKDLSDLAAKGVPEDRLAYALERQDARDTATAARLFKDLVSDPNVSIQARSAAAEFTAQQDGVDAGLAVLAAPSADQDALQLARVGLLKRHGRPDDAEKLLRDRASTKKTADAWADLAQFYLDAQRPDDAAAAASSGLAVAPNDDRLTRLDALAKVRAGNGTAATSAVLASALANPNVAPDLRAIADALKQYDADHNEQRLIDALGQVTHKYPASYEAWRELASACLRAGRTDDAVAAAVSAAQAIPGDPRAARLATEALAQANRTDEALAMADRWGRLAPSDAFQIDMTKVKLLAGRRKFDDALKLISPWMAQIIADADAHADETAVYAAVLAGAGQQNDARVLLGDRAQTDPVWAVRYVRIADILAPKPDEMRQWLLGLDLPEHPTPELLTAATQAWCRLALSTAAPADLQRATQLAERLATVADRRGMSSALLASLYQAKGETDAAIETYRAAMSELPEDPDVANNLAWLLSLRSPQSAAEAIPIAKRSVDLGERRHVSDSARAQYMDTLGHAQVRAGQYKSAADTYQQALAIDPASPDLLIGLAEAHLGLGDSPRARDAADRLDKNPAAAGRLSQPLATRLESVRQQLLRTP